MDEANYWEREQKATIALMRARCNLCEKQFMSLCAEDVVYETQSVMTPLQGKVEVAAYIGKKFAYLRDLQEVDALATHKISLGKINLAGKEDYPCIIFDIEGNREAIWYIALNGHDEVERINISSDWSVTWLARIADDNSA